MKNIIKHKLNVCNEKGIHARPSAEIVNIVKKCKGAFLFQKGKEEYNAKSLMGILMLDAKMGDVIVCSFENKVDEKVFEKIRRFVELDIFEYECKNHIYDLIKDANIKLGKDLATVLLREHETDLRLWFEKIANKDWEIIVKSLSLRVAWLIEDKTQVENFKTYLLNNLLEEKL
jgi:phosphocarrier protein HPr